MDDEAVRAQGRARLQQEKRLSYRALKRRLPLDDDALEDCKQGLIHAKRLAMDEAEQGLVWIGADQPSPVEAAALDCWAQTGL
jgi:hypothetical protein